MVGGKSRIGILLGTAVAGGTLGGSGAAALHLVVGIGANPVESMLTLLQSPSILGEAFVELAVPQVCFSDPGSRAVLGFLCLAQ